MDEICKNCKYFDVVVQYYINSEIDFKKGSSIPIINNKLEDLEIKKYGNCLNDKLLDDCKTEDDFAECPHNGVYATCD